MTIKFLNPATPTDNDPVGQGDDQLRQIKTSLTEAFGGPSSTGGLDGPILKDDGSYPTAAEWSSLFSAETEGDPWNSSGVPIGTIIMYTNLVPAPAGWVPCDGKVYAGRYGDIQTPDLRKQFIMGSDQDDPAYRVGTTGGQDPVVADPPSGSGGTVQTDYPPNYRVLMYMWIGVAP
jgi:hypothetical protein